MRTFDFHSVHSGIYKNSTADIQYLYCTLAAFARQLCSSSSLTLPLLNPVSVHLLLLPPQQKRRTEIEQKLEVQAEAEKKKNGGGLVRK